MQETLSFRLVETTDTVKITLNHVEGQDMVRWRDIERIFPGFKRADNGTSVISFVRGSDPQSPSFVLDVTLTTSITPTHGRTSKVDPITADKNPRPDAPVDSPIEDRVLDALEVSRPNKDKSFRQIALQVSRKARESEVEQRFISLLAPEAQEAVRASSDIYEAFSKAINEDDEVLSRAEVRQDRHFQRLEAMMAKNTELLYAKQEEARQLQEQILLNQKEMKQMQVKALEQLAVLQSRVQAVLTQTYELHEYPIPRLFVVLPQDPSVWDTVNPFANKFRLYFLCECGEHTKSINSKTGIPHHIHLAKHEGYEIARPSQFFEQYGAYVLTIMKMLKYTITAAGIVMPAFSQLISPVVLGQTITGLKLLQDTIVPGTDQVIDMMDNISEDHTEEIEGVTGQVENKEALEGADLRKLETFLKDKDGKKVLGNLYRTVTDEGHVKWVCVDHYRENYNKTAVDTFQRAVDSLGGYFDENNGLMRVSLGSRALAKQFYLALGNSRSVHELDIILDWECTGTDLQALEDALRKSGIACLHLDVQDFRPNISSKLSSLPVRYEALYRIMSPPNMKSVHIILPKGLFKLFNITPKKPPHLRKLSFSMHVRYNVRIHAEKLDTGFTETMLYSWDGSLAPGGAQVLFETLKTNSTLVTLDMGGYSIGDSGAQALSEALKTNSTLITLELRRNSIGDSGAQALSEALKANSTLTTLELWSNSIGDSGAQALSEALKANSTLTSLNLDHNSIGASGAQALSEALKTNSTLTTLNMAINSIGASGAQALSEALKTNSTLTTLNMAANSVGASGAQALSEALKTNSTLTTLNLGYNSIGDSGAQALSEALKTNSTLTTLNLEYNSTGDSGAQALSEALKTNSTLTTLDMAANSIGANGAQALSEALKTNSTLTALTLEYNSTGDSGAQALSEALKTNSTLTALTLEYNSTGDSGAQALSEALKTNSTLTTLDLQGNSIGVSIAHTISDAVKNNSARKIRG